MSIDSKIMSIDITIFRYFIYFSLSTVSSQKQYFNKSVYIYIVYM